MISRISFASSLLTILTILPHETPAVAQRDRIPQLTPTIPFPLLQPTPTPPKVQDTAKPIVIADLIEQLRTADVAKRREIIEQLSDTQENIVPGLIAAMEDPDPLLKSGVAEILGNLTDAAVPAIPGLVEMLKNQQRAIAPGQVVFNRPINIPIRVLQPIPVLLPFPSSGNQVNIKEKRIPPTPPENPENLVRITAIIAIGKIGLPARQLATPPLTEALKDPNPWVRLNATWALAEIGTSIPLLSHWLEALQSSDPNLRNSAARVFDDSRSLLRKVFGAEANAKTVAPLLTVLDLAVKDSDFTVRNAAREGLELLGIAGLPGLIQGLKASEPTIRLEAAKLIGNLGGSAQLAIPDLVALLKDSGRYLPPNTNLNALGLPLVPSLTPVREQYPPSNPDDVVQVDVAIALGKIGDRKVIPALTKALKEGNPWMQLATGWALLRLGDTQGLPVVAGLLQSSDSLIQREAVYQLQGYGAESAAYLLPYYTAQLDSTDDNTRNNAIIAIGKFGVAALDLVPKLRSLLVGKQKDSPGYAATILGEIAQDTASAWLNGSLSASQRQQAIAQLSQVLNIMQAPNARFNREPMERVRNALTTLRGSKQ
ncbi:MAG TPA: hypothetical protein DEG17_19515 [Cyanobacteria bacterium UBA11149]|nr:hypothetical protein [Cyanobacteria bacterium UBA11367]HBE56241.1 hypothetical protein [Cyanobacteria bacterium UBA11366]HBK64646.1 hypothetical protein [Cyanobacteria bacterium UBA11166]HBR76210.1 hypothetical protein [Cyanobacteria bacterium UBA11159]HBS68128.1 hypothetical protein [Cyanobacteria bacterium UBA11153]HBW90990.1 hypothetical protein [Cyanobacteria bacterium UBA11149]HCA94228.1 hypothetical protein [Cyanobacteria bacterium UBA9226]